MRRVLIVVAALLIMSLGTSIVSAQVPYVEFVFSHRGGSADCPPDPPGTVLDSAFVVANNFGMWMSAIEYGVSYPPEIIFLSDNTTGLNIGSSDVGISTAWPLPQNAFDPLIVNEVKFLWNCQGCPETNIPIPVGPNTATGFLQAVRWPDNGLVSAVGMTSLICSTIPIEETTWGNIKALYKK
ncbi:MAG: hypothetical protein GTO51_09825 [Candidatus Latescibacteria bacterium]|nr:hypothetical protein [Candidatus Latescibacterota bacterium]NIM22227.1 hypothetical protein [Candidatus Latescibacterota bacterium]NIM66266.1 hypothetical protein [Candidatus Latescibacterota bacterium]NIO02343.1 hypothetical protein [Candidatus Latescibacterota bacterium]NIO29874.1 hypothetical protein [Candidatus Latescibacterota bacterium]